MSTPRTGAMKALIIRLHDETFALDAESVREILDHIPVAHVPHAPAFVSGLINVRGRVVPLADLRVAFGMERAAIGLDTRIVVVEVAVEGEPTTVGIIADKVHEVRDIGLADIEAAPRVGMRWRPDFVKGVGKHDGDFVIVPDMDRIFESQGARSASGAAVAN